MTAVTGGGTAERVIGLRMALWIAMIPPASSNQRISVEAGPVDHRRQRLGLREAANGLGQVAVGVLVAGDCAEDRDQAVEPERVEGRERLALGTGDLEDHQPAARAQHPGHLCQPLLEVGEVAGAEADRDRVEARVAVGEIEGIGPAELHRQALLAALLPGQLQHRLGEVAADHPSVRADPPAQRQGEVAGAAADVERVRAGADLGAVDRPLAPPVMKPGRHR